jgi:hypothetical protein
VDYSFSLLQLLQNPIHGCPMQTNTIIFKNLLPNILLSSTNGILSSSGSIPKDILEARNMSLEFVK